MNVLANSINWEEAHHMAHKINKPKILLFSEEESSAAELNQKLKNVNKKLWINPIKFDNPDDLMMLNTNTIRSYLLPGGIVINSLGKKHLENLCKKTNKDLEKASINFDEKKLKIKHYNTDLRLINKNKKQLALRWINVSIKQLFYRDRHIFNSFYKK